jgi:hypothetical protein
MERHRLFFADQLKIEIIEIVSLLNPNIRNWGGFAKVMAPASALACMLPSWRATCICRLACG